jgi:hypothetical protein
MSLGGQDKALNKHGETLQDTLFQMHLGLAMKEF